MTKYLDNEGLTHFTGKMKEYADGKAGEVDSKVTTHVGNKQNPHGVTKAQVGLGSVDNVQQIPLSQKGVANGVATLDTNGKVPVEQMPTTKTINGASIFGSGNLQLSASLYKIVDTLPTTDIDTSKIYLVPASATTAKNNKTEYIYLGDPNKAYDESKWEKLGDEQKSSTVTTPGGSITVDTALIENSPNPVAGGVVKSKIDEIDTKLAKKVESSDYTTKMTAIDSKLETLENKTIDVDAELKDSPNPVQNRAVKKAVDDLNTAIGKKANSTDLNAATGKITTLETNAATILSVTGEGNGISSISKSGNTITATKGNFLTSAAGLATTAALNDGLAKKADVNHNHDTKYAAKEHTHPEYAQSSALNDYVTNTALDGKNFLTATSLNGYVNEVQPDGTQSGNGIANITKEGKILKVTKATFLTEHQSLAGYATKTWVNEQGFATGTIPTNVSQLTNDSGFLTNTALNGYVNEVQPDGTSGNGIANITKEGKVLKVTKSTFLTEHQSLADYATQAWVRQNAATQEWVKSQKYLTANDLQETIKITLVSTKSTSDAALRGAKITVKNGSSTIGTYTWQGSVISLKVASGLEVTVSVSDVTGYKTPAEQKFMTAMSNIREVKMEYKEQRLGVYILETDGTMTEPENWNKGNSSTVLGVFVGGENCSFVMAPEGENRQWSSGSFLYPGVKNESTEDAPINDFDGIGNTKKIIDALPNDTSNVAYYCNQYEFKNGKKGYLFALGEALLAYNNIDKIKTAYTRLQNITVADSFGLGFWTSNQQGSSQAWACGASSFYSAKSRYGSYLVIPACQY